MTDPEQWRHVPCTQNPADLATRGLPAEELAEISFWMEGPSFLKTGEASLPPAPSRGEETITDDPVRRATQTYMSDNRADFDIDPSRFSTFSRLCHVSGWIKRFAKNCRRLRESRQLDSTTSLTEVREAETFWVKQAQSEGRARRMSPSAESKTRQRRCP